jgi:hypothetical protein
MLQNMRPVRPQCRPRNPAPNPAPNLNLPMSPGLSRRDMALASSRASSLVSLSVPRYEEDESIGHLLRCKNMNPALAKMVGISARSAYAADGSDMEDISGWIPPSVHGLENSVPILPRYYFTSSLPGLVKIDYYHMVMDDVRNLRQLNPYQIQYIAECCNEAEKMAVIREYNRVVEIYGSMLLQQDQ